MKIVPPLERRTVLGVVIAALVPGFALTHTIVNRYKQGRLDLAQAWATTGERDLQTGDADAAVLDYETALSYTPERDDYRLRLAEALIAAKRPNEADARLEVLWASQPGSGKINLELARLAAGRGDIPDAVRYYHGAVDGAWETGAGTARRQARIELAKLLLANNERMSAQAELIAIMDDLPPDPALMTDIGAMLKDAGANLRALDLFRRALKRDPANARAARLAGELEYAAGQYALAERDLKASSAHAPLDDAARDMLDVSRRVMSLDPYARGIVSRERARRALHDLDIARDRFARCEAHVAPGAAPDPTMTDIVARLTAHAHLRQRTLEHDSDALDDTLGLVFDIERLPESACGPSTADDRALVIIAGQRASRTP